MKKLEREDKKASVNCFLFPQVTQKTVCNCMETVKTQKEQQWSPIGIGRVRERERDTHTQIILSNTCTYMIWYFSDYRCRDIDRTLILASSIVCIALVVFIMYIFRKRTSKWFRGRTINIIKCKSFSGNPRVSEFETNQTFF